MVTSIDPVTIQTMSQRQVSDALGNFRASKDEGSNKEGTLQEKNPFTTHKTRRSLIYVCLLYTSPSPRDVEESRMPSSA